MNEDFVTELKQVPVTPIDLSTALSLAGVRSPEFLLAQQRVVEAVAVRQLTAVQILPTINLGTSYDGHQGVLQQSSGNILAVNRNSLYVGAGASAVAAGTVNVPGVVWNLNVSEGIYAYLIARQNVVRTGHLSDAARNRVGLEVAQAYLELLQSEGIRSARIKSRDETREVARTTTAFAKAGQGRLADADRAATELSEREASVMESEGDVLSASSRLCQLLDLDPSLRLHATDNWIVPHPIVPDMIPLPELLAIALLQRPEMQERQANVQQTLLSLQSARLLPFSPNVLIGYSAGGEGGGSNLVPAETGTTTFGRSEPRFGNFGGRSDFDVVAYWSLRNLGVGNKAQIDASRSRLRQADLQWLQVMDQVRKEVASAYIRTHARYARIELSEAAVKTATDGFREDLVRTRNGEGLPIEVLDSLRLLAQSRSEYARAMIDYNRAQFELYSALGNPPANILARPIEVDD